MAAPAAPDVGNEAGILSIPQLLFQRVNLLGERTAMRLKEFGLWQDISWKTYGEKVRQAAMGLAALGVEPGDTVAVIGENRPEWLYADPGRHGRRGGDHRHLHHQRRRGVRLYTGPLPGQGLHRPRTRSSWTRPWRCGATAPNLSWIVVVDTEGLRHFSDPMVMDFQELLDLGRKHDAANPGLFEARLAARGPDDLALLIYTSGTTGPPKGAHAQP